jgi:hypothetical protein
MFLAVPVARLFQGCLRKTGNARRRRCLASIKRDPPMTPLLLAISKLNVVFA